MTTFIIIGVLGLALLLISFVFDGILDIFDFDFGADGIFSTSAFLGFFAAFGFGGWLTLGFIDSIPIAIIVGLVAGVIVGAISGVIMRFMRNAESGSVDRSSLVGQVGSALYSAKAGEAFDFTIMHHGMRTKLAAYADIDVKNGQPLKVDHVVSSTRVHVSPLSDEITDITQ